MQPGGHSVLRHIGEVLLRRLFFKELRLGPVLKSCHPGGRWSWGLTLQRTPCHPGAPLAPRVPLGEGSWGPRAGLAAAGTDRNQERAPHTSGKSPAGGGETARHSRASRDHGASGTGTSGKLRAGHSDREWCTHTRAHMHLCTSHA